MKANKGRLRQDADFTEDSVALAIASFLSVIAFPRYRFSIEPFSRAKERWLGADAKVNGALKSFRPFYMQFKRPSAYPDISMSKIITDRKNLKLSVSPRVLYFNFREKQSGHKDYQHNVLYRLRRRLIAKSCGDAAYVCPLFLGRSAYIWHLHRAGLTQWQKFWRRYPWDYESVAISSDGTAVNFDRVPVLREHVSIPPHELVPTAKHAYSFTEQGKEICFHSPTIIPDGSVTLGQFMTTVTRGWRGQQGFVTVEEAKAKLFALFAEDSESGEPLMGRDWNAPDNGVDAWLQWGDYLQSEFGIEQYAFLRWDD